ncbi:MAG TPA: CBS domain-containing protein [Phototrophicaceae bacterium]|nr:CBS domain-containing protein [Phototrophicaceae bacterium]
MNVCDVMTVHPATTASEMTLLEAVETMREVGCHHLPVISAEKHLIGILSMHDCEQALGESLEKSGPIVNLALANAVPVSMVMTPAPIIVEPDAPAYEAARLMLEHFIGCLPVMRGETLVGIITRSDLLMAFMSLSRRNLRQPYP